MGNFWGKSWEGKLGVFWEIRLELRIIIHELSIVNRLK